MTDFPFEVRAAIRSATPARISGESWGLRGHP